MANVYKLNGVDYFKLDEITEDIVGMLGTIVKHGDPGYLGLSILQITMNVVNSNIDYENKIDNVPTVRKDVVYDNTIGGLNQLMKSFVDHPEIVPLVYDVTSKIAETLIKPREGT